MLLGNLASCSPHEKEPSCHQIKILLSWVGGLQFHCVTRQVLLSRVVQFNWALWEAILFLDTALAVVILMPAYHSCFGILAFGCVHGVIMSSPHAVRAATMLVTVKPLEAPPQWETCSIAVNSLFGKVGRLKLGIAVENIKKFSLFLLAWG